MPATNFEDVPAADLVDDALRQLKTEGPKVINLLRKIMKSRLLARLSSKNENACAVTPDVLTYIVESVFSTVQRSRQSLIVVIDAVQQMKKNENDIALILREASRALNATKGIVASFENISNTKDECLNSVEAIVSVLEYIGNVLKVLGSTNLVTIDGKTKSLLVKGGEATKILGNVVRSLKSEGFTSLCPDSPTFNSDVFLGVSTALKGFRDIVATLGGGGDELLDLDRTAQTIRDSAVSIFLYFPIMH